MRRILSAGLILTLLIFPRLEWLEHGNDVRLARTLYTLGAQENYETLLMLGSVIMNRVDNAKYPNTLQGVLNEMASVSRDLRYDEQCFRAARELMMGRRTLPQNVLYFGALNDSCPAQGELYAVFGMYAFYEIQ